MRREEGSKGWMGTPGDIEDEWGDLRVATFRKRGPGGAWAV